MGSTWSSSRPKANNWCNWTEASTLRLVARFRALTLNYLIPHRSLLRFFALCVLDILTEDFHLPLKTLLLKSFAAYKEPQHGVVWQVINTCLLKYSKNRCCGYLLESSWWGDSDKYSQHIFLGVLNSVYILECHQGSISSRAKGFFH